MRGCVYLVEQPYNDRGTNDIFCGGATLTLNYELMF